MPHSWFKFELASKLIYICKNEYENQQACHTYIRLLYLFSASCYFFARFLYWFWLHSCKRIPTRSFVFIYSHSLFLPELFFAHSEILFFKELFYFFFHHFHFLFVDLFHAPFAHPNKQLQQSHFWRFFHPGDKDPRLSISDSVCICIDVENQ